MARKMTNAMIADMVEKHKKWLNNEPNGERADFSDAVFPMNVDLSEEDLSMAIFVRANLSKVRLSKAKLTIADFSEATLTETNLFQANLHMANLWCADLYRAELRKADLSMANLTNAELYGANLSRADLSGANFSGASLLRANCFKADFSNANFFRANLHMAELSKSNLAGICLSEANLYEADLTDAKNLLDIPLACPEEGEFIGWKKASNCIVKLLIPADAIRLSATGKKCRCNKAKVLAITRLNGTAYPGIEVRSNFDRNFIYRIGETIEVEDFEMNRWNECSAGIHFFISRQEAVDY